MASSYEIKGKRLILKNNEEGYLDDDEKKKIPNTFTEIEFPSQYEQLYSDDFKWCKEALGRTTLLDFSKAKKMTSIDDETFTGAKNLVVVVLPENLEYSPEFKKCPELKELHIGKEADTNYGITKDGDKRLTVYCSSPSLGDSFDNQFLKDVGVLYVDKRYLKNYEKARDDYDDELDIRPFPEGYSFPKQPLSKPWCDTIASSDSTFKKLNQASKTMAQSVSDSNLKTKDMNNNQSEMANAIEKQIKALQEGPKFDKEFMVYFDSQKAEGPYNDVYMFCYIKHGIINPDTLIAEKGKSATMRAGDCKELEDFFNLFETGDKEDLSDDIQEVSEESDLGGNIPKMLLNLYFDNKDLFEEVDGADEALDHIHELSVDVDKLNKNHDRMFFSIDDMECYLKENLTDSQNAVVKRMVKETYRFLLHTKWDADLPAELVDLTVEVAELFDDSFSHIDNILRGAYKMRKNSSGRDVDGILHFLEGRFVDDAIPTPNQEKILRQIAEIMYAFIHPQEETPEEALHKAWDEKLSKSLIDNFIENADLFNNENGSELIDEDILESIYTQTESFNLEEAEVHFQVSDLEGYANEELTDKQSVELKKLARKVLGFLLHRKWDETLPPKMIDLIIEVADLFDDSYDEKYIDRKICVFTYNLKGDDSFEIDDFTDRLEGILVDDVTPTAEQEKILHEIAVMMHNYVNS